MPFDLVCNVDVSCHRIYFCHNGGILVLITGSPRGSEVWDACMCDGLKDFACLNSPSIQDNVVDGVPENRRRGMH